MSFVFQGDKMLQQKAATTSEAELKELFQKHGQKQSESIGER